MLVPFVGKGRNQIVQAPLRDFVVVVGKAIEISSEWREVVKAVNIGERQILHH